MSLFFFEKNSLSCRFFFFLWDDHRGGVVVGRQQRGVSSDDNMGGEVDIFWSKSKKRTGPEIIVKRAVSCYMGLDKKSKMAKNFVDLTPICRPMTTHAHPVL